MKFKVNDEVRVKPGLHESELCGITYAFYKEYLEGKTFKIQKISEITGLCTLYDVLYVFNINMLELASNGSPMFKAGQKVITPLGIGEVLALGSSFNGIESYRVRFTLPKDENGYLHPVVEFPHYHLKPYKTPHERLLDRGFRQSQKTLVNNTLHTIYEIDGGSITIIEGKENFYKTKMKINPELSRILADYLEWLEEEK